MSKLPNSRSNSATAIVRLSTSSCTPGGFPHLEAARRNDSLPVPGERNCRCVRG
jgi:hypothetical protein